MQRMTLTVHDVEQGSQEWLDLRCGLLTASAIGQLITPKTVQVAANDTARALIMHLSAERITGYTEPTYASADMERGKFDEPYARDVYSEHYAEAVEVGFMTNEINGHTLGYSPDGVVSDNGLIEIKSRRQKQQLATILADAVPLENMAQCQTGLLVTGRKWLDYVSYCAGMPLYVKRIYPDQRWFDAITAALESFEVQAADMIAAYTTKTNGAPKTERALEIGELTF
jgi:hypothetical protein